MIRVLGIPGSLRRGSYNRGLLRAAQELAPSDLELELFELHDIPPYNADVEAAGDPTPVSAFKDAIRRADALLIATPEYNRGVPGVLKNAIDWVSRPPLGSALTGKLVGLMGASTGMSGTARAQQHVTQALSFPRARVVDEPRVLVPTAYEKFDDEGRLVDPATRNSIASLLDALLVEAGARRAVEAA
jgi:chromate reductase, NAD(P)H dehydrogenase (quinone)